jgi:murein DD-endopeptidase MepM/ murein hydrolase activator NlpD
VLLCLFILIPPALPAGAQDDAVIHVVQPGENLFRIALNYGVSMDTVASANGITDMTRIYAGQELVIPGADPGALGGSYLVTHVVQPGDTVRTLAHRYGTTVEQITESNNIAADARLSAGQSVSIAQPPSAPVVERGWFYTVQEGDTLMAVARRYGLTPQILTWANFPDHEGTPMIYPGQELVIPGSEAAPVLKALPAPLVDFTIDPAPASQGYAFGLHITTSSPAAVTGAFLGRPVYFGTSDGYNHTALLGVHVETAPGSYPFLVFVRDQADALVQFDAELTIEARPFGVAHIPVTASQSSLLDLWDTELALLESYMSGTTPERYWDGAFTAPVASSISAYFGTKRTYGAGDLSTFHAGVDFNSAPGTAILAPAAGRVVMTGVLDVRGNATIIDHGWGVYSGFWHQSVINVSPGEWVQAGQTIGAVGNTGLSTGPHLHWEMWVGGVPVDPLQWLQRAFP